jgi:dipeptidyl aminopeptidase/acylaminoacyl peptidase
VDAVVGGTPRQVTSGDFNHTAPAWSADGKTLLVSGIRNPDAEYLRNDSEIYAIALDTLAVTPLTDRKGPDTAPHVSPDGRWVAYTGFDDQNFTNHVGRLYLMDARGGGTRAWAARLPSSPSPVGWAPDSSGFYYSMQERGEDHLYFVAIALGAVPWLVTTGAHVPAGVSLAKTGRAAAIRSSVTQPGVLVTFEVAKPAGVKVLVDVNRDVLDGVTLATAEELWFTAPDGVRAQGWLMKPAQFAYPGKDYDDLMAGVDAALTTGWVDAGNLFVCGGSGGGVLTAWIVGRTDRFSAAVSMRPVINWHSFVGTTDGIMWYTQFRTFPWEDPQEYAARSPLSLVGNVVTPTMVMTGEADLRTPILQSEEYYRALKMLRKADTLLVRMPEEFHGWRRPSRQLRQQLYLMAWFEKYCTTESKSAVTTLD